MGVSQRCKTRSDGLGDLSVLKNETKLSLF